MNKESIIAIIPAAGIGVRARSAGDGDRPKQYKLLRGEPMLRHAVRALLADTRIDQVRVAVDPSDGWAESALLDMPRTSIRRCGGATRAETVANALVDANMAPSTWVLVHDAARPGLPASALAVLIDSCLQHDRGGLLALPVADTVKRAASQDGGVDVVGETLSRNGLWLAQTPQLYRAAGLRRALAHAREQGIEVTDESQAMELAGMPPLLIRGAMCNTKVTWPEDFDLMEKWL